MKNERLSFENEIESFLLFKESLGYKRISYEVQLNHFARFCDENHFEEDYLSREIVTEYLDCQTSDLARKASILRMFAIYLNAIGKESYVIPVNMYRGKKSKEPYIFSDDELTRLFREIDRIDYKKKHLALVAPVLFRLIYTCGLRPQEGRELKYENINFDTGEIFIENTKRKKERTIVMSDDMLNLCISFNAQRKQLKIFDEYFFAKPDGGPYMEQTINNLFVSCWRKANPETSAYNLPRVRVYCLRHRFATAVIHRWIAEGKNLRNKLPYLQQYMGHNHLNETMYYVHLLPENLVKSAGIDWNSFDGIVPEVIE